MMLDLLRLIAAILLIFFIPGLMMVQALFPRKGELDSDFDWLYRLGLGIGLSIVITILASFGLNSLGVNPDTGMGYVTAVPTTLALISVSMAFFALAWFRGGMPFMGKLHPALIRFPPADPKDDDIPRISDRVQRFRHQQLMRERFGLMADISKAERLTEAHSGEQRKYYSESREKLMARLADVEARIDAIERGISRAPERKEEDVTG